MDLQGLRPPLLGQGLEGRAKLYNPYRSQVDMLEKGHPGVNNRLVAGGEGDLVPGPEQGPDLFMEHPVIVRCVAEGGNQDFHRNATRLLIWPHSPGVMARLAMRPSGTQIVRARLRPRPAGQ